MPVLLHLDSSPLGAASISRHLSAQFVDAWNQAHPGGQVITRDLNATPLPVIDAAWIAASYTPVEARTEAQKEILALSDTLVAELRTANEYVFGVPMHNFTIPAALRLWIDQIARSGETFSYASNGPVGLLEGKKATFIISSGGVYGKESVMASYDFVEPYLRTAFNFLGVSEIRIYPAGGASAIQSGKIDREEFLKTHGATIKADFHIA